MSNPLHVDGATRLYPIIGDPIAQVKSPAGISAVFSARGANAIVVPVHTAPGDVDDFIRTAGRTKNIDGIIVTIPHKIASARHCATLTERARIIGSVNVLRRNADGTWHGENFDGQGMVGGIRSRGGEPRGKRTLLVGAGGAGMAIAQALLEEGVAELAIHDVDEGRRDGLVTLLRGHYGERVHVGTDDPEGFSLVVNATPVGMRSGDPYPVRVDRLAPDAFVGCVITSPAVSPWVQAARDRGNQGSVGFDMYQAEQGLMVDFFLDNPARPG